MQNIVDDNNSTKTIKCWVELYSDSLYSWAFHKTSSHETAEDLVQETFLSVVQSFEKFEGKSNPKTWIFAILNNKINDYHRNNFRKPISENPIIEVLFDGNEHWKKEEMPQHWQENSEHLLDNNEFSHALELCLKKLPSNWFSAMQLKYIEEKNGELICQELGLSPTNFWQMLHRAKLQLRKCLELNWFKKQ